MIEKTIGEYECARGQNASENWALLSGAEQDHYWFHLSSFPSGYVVLRKSDPTTDEIREAAEFCLEGTKQKGMRNVYVDYTTCGNVVRGEKPGEARFKSNRKVRKIKL